MAELPSWLEALRPTPAELKMQNNPAKYSRQIAVTDIILRSTQAQKVYRRFFKVVNSALLSLSVWLQSDPNTQKEYQNVADRISKVIAEVREQLDLAISSTMQKLKETGVVQFDEAGKPSIPGFQITHENPMLFHIEIRSPMAMKYLELLGMLDHFCNLENFLWFSGAVNNTENSNLRYKWQQAVGKVGSSIITLERELRKKSDPLVKEEDSGINYEEQDSAAEQAIKEQMSDDKIFDEMTKENK